MLTAAWLAVARFPAAKFSPAPATVLMIFPLTVEPLMLVAA